MTKETLRASTVPEPFGKPGGPGLFHIKGLQLPPYIQHVAHDLLDEGRATDESRAIHMAVGIVENWAAGHDGKGHKVSAEVQAAAIKAVAQWRAAIAKAHAIPNQARHFVASRGGGYRMGMYFDEWGREIALAMPPQLAAALAKKKGNSGAPPNATGHPNAAKRKKALAAGHALPPAKGAPPGKARFPIDNTDDLDKAFSMVQLAPEAEQPSIRRFIMKRARALNYANKIPANWNPDGTLKAKAA